MDDKGKKKVELTKKLETLKKDRGGGVLENNITKRKQAEEALRLHAVMMDNVAEGIYLTGMDDLLIKWTNEKFASMFGYDPGEMVGKKVDIINAPTESAPTETRISIVDVLKETGEWHGEVRNIKRDGTHFWCHANVSLFDHPEYGKVIVSVHTDITKRKQAENALAESEEKFRITLKNSPIVVWNQDKDLRYTWIYNPNPGFKPEKTIGKTDKELLPADDAEKLMHIKRKVLESGIGTREETKTTIQGNDYYYDLTVEPLLDSSNAIIGITCVAIDITERKQAEEELKDSEERLKILFDYTPDAYYVNDLKGNFVDGNLAAESLTGYKREELIGKNFLKLLSPTDIPKAAKLLGKSLKGHSTGPDELVLNRKDNTKVTVEISTYPVKIKGKTLVLGIARDITARKQAEERIKHLNLVLRAIRNVNQLIVKEKDREKLIKKACKSLTETRGYYSCWIVLLDEEGKFNTYVEAGLGKAFLPMVAQFMEGKLTACAQKALKQEDVTIIEDPLSACTDCPLAQEYSGRGAMTIRLEHSGKVYGLMSVSVPAHFIPDKEEQSLLKEVAGDITLGLHSIEIKEKLDEYTHHLKERVKEFNFLFQLSQLFEKTDISLEGIIQKLTGLLPAAWQYPKITCVRITFEGKEYKTENFKKTIWKLSKDIKIHKKIVGTLEVFYLEERPEADVGPFLKEEKDLITIIAERLGSFIDRKSSVMQLKQSYQKIKLAMNATIETMSKIIEVKDPYTSGHQKRVSQLAVAISKELNLPQEQIDGIRIASLIHDIGKIGIPTEILSKSIVLSDIEFNLIKAHSQIGYDILKSIDFAYPIAQIVLQHHEKIDGSGYPNHLKGVEILLESKIICVSDVVEAMSSHRPYRPALGIDAALEEISQNKDILYEPEVVDTCLRLFKEKGFKFE